MATDKDVLLAIRANVENVQSIQQVATAIGQITARLNEQVAAATRGEGSFDELKRSYEALKAAGADIAKTQVKINVFQGQEAALDGARARLAAATVEVQRLQAALLGIDAPTKAQARALREATTEQTRASTAAQKALTAYEKTGQELERLGVDIKNVGAAIEQTNAMWTRTSSVMALAKGATDQYSTSLQAFKASSAAAAAATALETKALQDKAAAATSLANFRQQGTAALSAQAGLLTTAVPAVDLSGQSQIAASLERISAPAQAARRTIQGLEQQIRELSLASVASGKTTQDYADILRGLGAAQTALGRAGTAVDQFHNQTAAVQQAKAALDAAHKSVFDLGVAVRTATVEDNALVASLRAAQTQLTSANATYRQQVLILRQYDAALKAAGIDTGQLAQVQQRLLQSATTLAPAIQRLAKLVREGDTPGGAPTVLGLRPYQLQNLGFQINDVFTQLASGTSITQTLAQQGGQILQLFPGAFSAMLRFLPGIVVALGAVGTAAATLIHQFREIGALREFTGLLTASQSGVTYQAAALVAAQKTIRDYGASFNDAGLAVREFLERDINPTRVVQFGKAAQDIVDVYGQKLPEAAKTLTTAFQGSIENIIKFNDEFKTLSSAQVQYIQLLFDTGKAEEGRALALDLTTKALAERAAVVRGPLTDATREMTAAWNKFLDELGRTAVFTAIVDTLTRAMHGLRAAIGGLNAQEVLAKATASVASLQGRIAEISRDPRYAQSGAAGERARARDIAVLNDELEKQFALLPKLAAATGAGTAASTANAQAVTGQGEATKTLNEGLRDGRRDRDAATTAVTAQTIAEERFLRGMKLEALQRADVKKLTRDEADELARLVGLKKGEEALALKMSDAAVKAITARAQADEAARIRRAQTEGGGASRAAIAAEESVVSMMAVFEARITGNQKLELDQRLLQFDEWLRKVRLSIEKARKAGATDIGGMSLPETDAAAVALVKRAKEMAQAKGAEQDLNELIRTRNDLIATNDALVAAEAMSQATANERNAAAYAASSAAIAEMSAKWLEHAKAAGYSQIALDAIAAKIQLIAVQARYVDPAMKALNKAIDDAIVSNAMTAFNDIGEALGGLIAGTKTWAETFKSLGVTTAKFFASLLKDVAAAILKMQLLNALGISGGGGGAGTGIFGFIGSLLGGGGSAASGMGAATAASPIWLHDGGVVGAPSGVVTSGPASWWDNAPRYHRGMPGVGLSANEQRAVLLKGEEVLSREDPRNVLNGGKGAQGGATEQPARFKQVLLVDPQMVPQAMVSAPGEQAFLTLISRHASTIRQLTGVR